MYHWPVPLNFEVYRDEDDHLADGEREGWDMADYNHGGLGAPLYAPADGVVCIGTGYDPHVDDGRFHAGNAVVLECGDVRFHFTHLPSVDLAIDEPVVRGQRIGEVGFTGSGITFDNQPRALREEEAHLHFWIDVYRDGAWPRGRPSDLEWDLIEETQEDDMQSMIDSLNKAWEKLDAIQQHPDATPAIIILAEEVKQNAVVEMKKAIGLQ